MHLLGLLFLRWSCGGLGGLLVFFCFLLKTNQKQGREERGGS